MKKLFILLIASGISFLNIAQNKWQFGFSAGKANYLGDLVEPSFTFDHGKFAGGLLLRYQLTNHINLRSNLLTGNLVGSDANYSSNPTRMASFETSFLEATLLGEYDLFHINGNAARGSGLVELVSPYAFAGIGFGIINPSVEFGSNSAEIAADRSNQFSDIQPFLPIGFGVKYNVIKNVIISLEMGLHLSFTDYLDGVSIAGNPDNKDHFVAWGANVVYQFGNRDADNDGIADGKDSCPYIAGPAKFNGCPDTDGDGLTDAEDDCPKEAGRALLKGCPDSDGDGVSDLVDDCPDHAGIRRLGGCPDTDNDGIVDPEDNCPTEAGIPSLNGCPDADRDGIMDSKDECPLEPGTLLLKGCPDTDGDGISDKHDKCPLEPGKPNNQGCPLKDTDLDGIFDDKDNCPDQAGPIENNGCPVIKQEDKEVLDLAMSMIEFETGSDELLPSSFEVLDKIVNIMKNYKGYRLTINGHTDNVGDPIKNKLLSEKRAESCYQYLISKGISPALMAYNGFGPAQPIADNSTEQGKRQNRRVEFLLTLEKQ